MRWIDVINQCVELGFTKNKDYVKNKSAFEHAATWAQNYLATNVQPILKKHIISNRSIPNIINENNNNVPAKTYLGEDIVFTASNAKAYYFECDGIAEVKIEDDTSETIITTTASDSGFKPYKGFCNGTVKITFTGDYAYSIQNVALYGVLQSADVNDIPSYSDYNAYDFKAMDPAFMSFALERPVYESGISNGYYYVSDYYIEEDKIIKLRRDERGQFLVWYNSYPTPITGDTLESFEIELDSNISDIMPYLMGYRLWLDDDSQKAVLYYNTANDLINEYNNTRERIKMRPAMVDIKGCYFG